MSPKPPTPDSIQDPPLHHPTLQTTLRGVSYPTTTQYRNLRYATIPYRWARSVSIADLSHLSNRDGTYDATRFGPSCPHRRGAQAWDVSLVGDVEMPFGEEGKSEEEEMNEFDCLHVTVTVPKIDTHLRDEGEAKGNSKTKTKGLPVFVWIHGGGLSMGSVSWPQYNLQRFVARSVEIGKPVVGVAINYRTNIFGFLASEELGAGGNYGYRDLEEGFRWVRRHIGGFGGDPGDVTAAGESAGGIALSSLLCAEVQLDGEGRGLFDRVVVMSGDVSLRRPRGREWHEGMYRDQLRYLGLEGEGVKERVKRLKEWDAEDLAQRLPLAQHFCGFVDGEWLKSYGGLGVLADGRSEVHKPKWCREFVIGDTRDDGTVLKTRILDNPSAIPLLHSTCAKHLTPTSTTTLLEAYGLPLPSTTSSSSTKPTSPPSQTTLRNLVSDLRFYLPTLLVHQGWKTKPSLPLSSSSSSSSSSSAHPGRYHFHIPNPVSGPFKDLSSHELDVAFLLQTFNHTSHFTPAHRRASEAMTDKFISFASGEGWVQEGKVVVFGLDGVREVEEREYDDEYRSGRGGVLVGLGGENMWRVAEGWQGVREDAKHGGNRSKL